MYIIEDNDQKSQKNRFTKSLFIKNKCVVIPFGCDMTVMIQMRLSAILKRRDVQISKGKMCRLLGSKIGSFYGFKALSDQQKKPHALHGTFLLVR